MRTGALRLQYAKGCGEKGSDRKEQTCNKGPKSENCHGDHPSDSRQSMEKRKTNQHKTFTRNISFPETRKIVEVTGTFSTKSYASVIKSNTNYTESQECHFCSLLLLRKLSKCTPKTLPDFLNKIKSLSLSDESDEPSSIVQKISTSNTSAVEQKISSLQGRYPQQNLLCRRKLSSLHQSYYCYPGAYHKAVCFWTKHCSWKKNAKKIVLLV